MAVSATLWCQHILSQRVTDHRVAIIEVNCNRHTTLRVMNSFLRISYHFGYLIANGLFSVKFHNFKRHAVSCLLPPCRVWCFNYLSTFTLSPSSPVRGQREQICSTINHPACLPARPKIDEASVPPSRSASSILHMSARLAVVDGRWTIRDTVQFLPLVSPSFSGFITIINYRHSPF